MTREELQKQMKYHFDQYSQLKLQLEELNSADKRSRIEKSQRAALEEFKSRYTLNAHINADPTPIDWESIETHIFNEENLSSLVAHSEGYSLGYDEHGIAGYSSSYKGGGTFTPFALDERDASIYKEREERRRKLARNR